MTALAHPRRWVHPRVGGKFFLAVGLVLLSMLGVTIAGGVGLARMRTQVDGLYGDNILTSEATANLDVDLGNVEKVALVQASTMDPARKAELDTQLDEILIPRVDQQLQTVYDLISTDPLAPQRLRSISTQFDQYLAMRRTGDFGVAAERAGHTPEVVARTAALFDDMTMTAEALRQVEVREAHEADQAAERTYRSTLDLLVGGSALALLVGLTVVLLLIRSLVPRIRHYSTFAARIAAGEQTEVLRVTGADELTDLGTALNDMVAARQQLSAHESAQTEFIETLQATANEEEAHGLLKRHLERTLAGSDVTVLIRNNSGNRLEFATTPGTDDDLPARIQGAEPRACLALRLGRAHREGEQNQLLECTVCEHSAVRSICEPLLVSGEVIGSVLVRHDDALTAPREGQIGLTVAQAAPVLANLRNLALAEFRANNDSLTGLPNKRATEDTFKRMIAQANRSLAPMGVVMMDLDHFKKINDQFGHGKGDEVLAAVGAAVQSCLRDSDFAGRFGGEEFLLLLPDTDLVGSMRAAERLREAVATLSVVGIDRAITASFGVAELIEHGGTPRGLLREADRALYAAKAAGRNCGVVARIDDSGDIVTEEILAALPTP